MLVLCKIDSVTWFIAITVQHGRWKGGGVGCDRTPLYLQMHPPPFFTKRTPLFAKRPPPLTSRDIIILTQ